MKLLKLLEEIKQSVWMSYGTEEIEIKDASLSKGFVRIIPKNTPKCGGETNLTISLHDKDHKKIKEILIAVLISGTTKKSNKVTVLIKPLLVA